MFHHDLRVYLLNEEEDGECILLKQVRKVASMTKKESMLEKACSFFSNTQHIRIFGCIRPENESEWSRDP